MKIENRAWCPQVKEWGLTRVRGGIRTVKISGAGGPAISIIKTIANSDSNRNLENTRLEMLNCNLCQEGRKRCPFEPRSRE